MTSVPVLSWLIERAAAQSPPPLPCGNLPGCGAADNVLGDSIVPGIAAEGFATAKRMMTYAIIGAVVVNLANALVQAVASFFGV